MVITGAAMIGATAQVLRATTAAAIARSTIVTADGTAAAAAAAAAGVHRRLREGDGVAGQGATGGARPRSPTAAAAAGTRKGATLAVDRRSGCVLGAVTPVGGMEEQVQSRSGGGKL